MPADATAARDGEKSLSSTSDMERSGAETDSGATSLLGPTAQSVGDKDIIVVEAGLESGLADVEKSAADAAPAAATTTTTAAPKPAQPEPSNARLIALVATLTGAAFLNTLAVQAAVLILPTIGKDLNIPAARQQWVVSSYPLTFGCFLLLWGRLADVYGKKFIFVWGSAWVCIVTLICPFVPNEIGFDVFRGLQGLGAAANVPTAIGLLGVTFPPGPKKNYAFVAYSAGAPMGSVFGNILGGVFGQYVSWKWVFYFLAIFAAMVTVAGHFVIQSPVIPPTKAELKNAVDWLGAIIITVGLLVLMFALTEGNVVGWSTPWIPVLIVVSLLLIVVFVLWQIHLEKRTTRPPLMKISIFANRRVSAAMFIMFCFVQAFNNFLVFATYFWQDYQGRDAIETTLRFLPTGVVGLLTVCVTSQLLARVKLSYILVWALLCSATANLLFALPISPRTTYWAYGLPGTSLAVFGADTIFPSLLLFTAQSLPREDQSIGAGMINAVGQVGRALGLAIATAIQTTVQESHSSAASAVTGDGDQGNAAYLAGLRAGNWYSVGIALLAFLVAAFGLRGAGKVGAMKR